MSSAHKPNPRAISIWLFACAFMVFAMMIIGAITRLTESGLSMVEWRPLIGSLPPLNQAEWERVFSLYQETPEFMKKNFWMEIGDFKNIFFWEWLHRLWGRTIGLVFALPLAYFWIRKMIPQGYGLKLFLMLILGGMQGVMGWYMVASGLVDIPAVSHFRLAAHLCLAFLILGLLLWLAFSLCSTRKHSERSVFIFGLFAFGVVAVTIIWGAFTAGLDGGLIYNTWPQMGGALIPDEVSTTGLKALILNPEGVQFTHRWLAIAALLSVLSFWTYGRKRRVSFTGFNLLALMALIQLGLGLATLLTGVNIVLATLHQAGAAIVVALMVYTLYQTKPVKKQA